MSIDPVHEGVFCPVNPKRETLVKTTCHSEEVSWNEMPGVPERVLAKILSMPEDGRDDTPYDSIADLIGMTEDDKKEARALGIAKAILNEFRSKLPG